MKVAGLATGGGKMTNMEQLQVVVSEVQAARAQVANFNAQLNELEMTIEAVKQQPEGYSLHKNLGNVLIEVTDKDKLISELENQLLILKDAVVRIGEKEAQLMQSYELLKKEIEG